ncbi:MAG TPA: hypothetical protein VIG51_07040, partial [Candidatus Baltobacteraceae bacterium]
PAARIFSAIAGCDLPSLLGRKNRAAENAQDAHFLAVPDEPVTAPNLPTDACSERARRRESMKTPAWAFSA